MTSSELRVRRARPGDWATVRDIRLAALADAPDVFASTLDAELGQPEPEWRARIGALPWFLGFVGGQPAGLVAALLPQPGPGHDPAWHLVSMWVSPHARGSGLADRLVAAVTEQARRAGAARVTLWVTVGNDRARAFYRRMGFTPTGRRQQYPRPGAAALDEEEFGCPLSDPQRGP
ncbi:MAG: N-acetyltransferase family protein [Streptosporangiaceae bacterium]